MTYDIGKRKINAYLRVLRLVPDNIILAIAGDEFRMFEDTQCVCGRIVQETVQSLTQQIVHLDGHWSTGLWGNHKTVQKAIPSVTRYMSSVKICQTLYGGNIKTWCELYRDAALLPDLVETALTIRVLEAI